VHPPSRRELQHIADVAIPVVVAVYLVVLVNDRPNDTGGLPTLVGTAGAVIGIFALIFAPPFLGGLLPAWFAENVIRYLPGAAGDAISVGHLPGAGEDLLPAAVAAVGVVAWLAVFLGAAWAVFERRDA
jgi:hypothetical protein